MENECEQQQEYMGEQTYGEDELYVQDGGGEFDALATYEEQFSLVRHNRLERVAALIEQGFDVCETRDGNGNTALCVACQNGHKRMVKLLLRAGGDLHCRNAKGNTPLHFCYMYGFTPLATYLESKGAQHTENMCGLSPPEMAQYTAAELRDMEEAAPSISPDQLQTMSGDQLSTLIAMATASRAPRVSIHGARDGECSGGGREAASPGLDGLSREERHRRIKAKARTAKIGLGPPPGRPPAQLTGGRKG